VNGQLFTRRLIIEFLPVRLFLFGHFSFCAARAPLELSISPPICYSSPSKPHHYITHPHTTHTLALCISPPLRLCPILYAYALSLYHNTHTLTAPRVPSLARRPARLTLSQTTCTSLPAAHPPLRSAFALSLWVAGPHTLSLSLKATAGQSRSCESTALLVPAL
jgi:hypothetical protein